jgi:cyclopropane-fatty-acyl-phospholipid synthase
MTDLDLPQTLITETLVRAAPATPVKSLPLVDRLVRGVVIRRLLTLDLPLEIREAGVAVVPSRHPAPLRVDVHDSRFWAAIAFDGSNGSGDAWTEGWWTTDDLTSVVRLFARHVDELSRLDGGLARIAMPLFKFAHRARRNTRQGAKENIHAHYDLGNAFFRRWLDPTLTYSSAWFTTPELSLEAAQLAKIDRLLARIELKAGEHLVEIGTGWGGLALRAAERGARVTTVTISQEQHRLATERVAAAGLADRIDVRLCDYRDLTGTYDKLVSVEMIEAVGREFYAEFFATVSRLLAPGGIAAIQGITIREQHFARAAKEADFIKRRIFPGCCIPSVEALLAAMGRASDLNLIHFEDFAAHYARTLEAWRAAFKSRADELRGLGYDDRFQRLWEFYLSYCAGGFAERTLGVAHLVFAKPAWRAPDHAALVGPAAWEHA